MPRCEKGTRKNKKTGNCEKYPPIAKSPKAKSPKAKSPSPHGKRPRCKSGTRRNKKTGNCESVAVKRQEKELSKIVELDSKIVDIENKENEHATNIININKKEEQVVKKRLHAIPIPNIARKLETKLALFENKKKTRNIFTLKIKDELAKVASSVSRRHKLKHLKKDIVEQEIDRKQKIEDAQKRIEKIAKDKVAELDRLKREKDAQIEKRLKECETAMDRVKKEQEMRKDLLKKNREIELKQEQINREYEAGILSAEKKQNSIMNVIRSPTQEELNNIIEKHKNQRVPDSIDDIILMHKGKQAHSALKAGIEANYAKKSQKAFTLKINKDLATIAHHKTKKSLLGEGIKQDLIIHNLNMNKIVIDHDKLQIENTRKKLQEIAKNNMAQQKEIIHDIDKELERRNREFERQMAELDKNIKRHKSSGSASFHSARSSGSASFHSARSR